MSPADQLEQWADSYGREIHAYLFRMLGDPDDAEDCLQETYVRAWRGAGRERIRNARAWLYAVAGNVARSHLRRRGRDQAHRASAADETAPDRHRLLEQVTAVRQAVEALPTRQRQALLLRRFQGLSYREIAAALGGTPGAARANVYQAMRKLRRALPEAGA